MSQTTNGLAEAYFRFLNLSQAVQGLSSQPQLDADEEQMLNTLSLHWYQEKTLSVTEAMQLAHLGSPATLHRRIMSLRNLGLIEIAAAEDSTRTKLLVPSSKALSYFKRLGQSIEKAAKAIV